MKKINLITRFYVKIFKIDLMRQFVKNKKNGRWFFKSKDQKA